MPFAPTADGLSIHYRVHGSGDPLVLLSGQANSSAWWDPVLPDFAAAHRTVVLDWRGTGRSDAPADAGYSTRGFAADVVAVLDHAGIGGAHVYGTSMGGRVAQWLAAEHPERISSLVLGCTSPGGPHGIERDPQVRRSLADPDPAAARRALLELMYTPAWLATHPGPHATLGDATMSAPARRGHLRASNGHDAWAALPSIGARTLIVHGSADRLNPVANAPLLAERIPDARVELIEGARHAYFEEFRDTASGLVLEFLRAR